MLLSNICVAIGSHRLNTRSNFFMSICLLTYVHECCLQTYRITISVACSKNQKAIFKYFVVASVIFRVIRSGWLVGYHKNRKYTRKFIGSTATWTSI